MSGSPVLPNNNAQSSSACFKPWHKVIASHTTKEEINAALSSWLALLS